MDYVRNHGKKGVCFSYNASIQSKRMVFMSAGFIREHFDLSEIVKFGIAAIDSKWKEIPTMEEFAELSVRRPKRLCFGSKLCYFLVFQMIATCFHVFLSLFSPD